MFLSLYYLDLLKSRPVYTICKSQPLLSYHWYALKEDCDLFNPCLWLFSPASTVLLGCRTVDKHILLQHFIWVFTLQAQRTYSYHFNAASIYTSWTPSRWEQLKISLPVNTVQSADKQPRECASPEALLCGMCSNCLCCDRVRVSRSVIISLHLMICSIITGAFLGYIDFTTDYTLYDCVCDK